MNKCMNTETDKMIRINKKIIRLRCVRQSLREGISVFSPFPRGVST